MIRNPLTWCLWAIAALLVAFIDRNPFLQGLLLLVLINVWLPYRRGGSGYLRIGLALAIIPIVFSVALSRFGHHVLFVLPAMPIIGGAWTLDALAFGASSGAALFLTVAVFRVLQSTVRSADLIALLPAPFYRAGTVFALSLAFAPKTVASFQSIREARQLRGRRTSWRSTPALLVPLLLTTLEQSLQYSESLDARGYGSRRRSRYRPIATSLGDVVVMTASLAALMLTALWPASPYNPYEHLAPAAPSFMSVMAILLLATPAALAAVRRGD
jgi:energy-coupling factor transport system permease protein